MIRVDGSGRAGSVGGAGSARRSGGKSSFSLPQDEAEGPKSGLSVGTTTDVSSLIALQEVEDPLQRRRRSVKRGGAMLDELEQLKLELLGGTISPDRLGRLATLLSEREPTGDQGLENVMDDIELRVRVEMAKLGHFTS